MVVERGLDPGFTSRGLIGWLRRSLNRIDGPSSLGVLLSELADGRRKGDGISSSLAFGSITGVPLGMRRSLIGLSFDGKTTRNGLCPDAPQDRCTNPRISSGSRLPKFSFRTVPRSWDVGGSAPSGSMAADASPRSRSTLRIWVSCSGVPRTRILRPLASNSIDGALGTSVEKRLRKVVVT